MEQKKNQKRGVSNIFYGVIGVATLMIATIGATFAYFTATASNNATITGNMATIGFDLVVTKMTNVDQTKGGLIPMSNNMVEQALTKNEICVDDNGNAVCQVYKITVINTSSASMFVDGYVTLSNGSGVPADYTATTTNKTTMRWAQAFCSAESSNVVTDCTTGGTTTVRATNDISWDALGGSSVAGSGLDTTEIKTERNDVVLAQGASSGALIQGNRYEVINRNYIRVSDHIAGNTSYTRANDTTSALVYSQYLEANDGVSTNNVGTSSTDFKDAQSFYIVVWLSENGHNQTAGATNAASDTIGFFQGSTTFVSAQGNEVTATFVGHQKVAPNT